mgnify:CR=1 FL=1
MADDRERQKYLGKKNPERQKNAKRGPRGQRVQAQRSASALGSLKKSDFVITLQH